MGRPTPGGHGLLRGLRGSLIPFAPHAFSPHRLSGASGLPSPSAFHPGSTHCTGPPGIPPTSPPHEPGAHEGWPMTGLSPSCPVAGYGCCTPNQQRSLRGSRFTTTAGTAIGPRFLVQGLMLTPAKEVCGMRHPVPVGTLSHEASLGQACAHCPRFLTAATQWCPGRSQSRCGGSHPRARYPSSTWWALPPPTISGRAADPVTPARPEDLAGSEGDSKPRHRARSAPFLARSPWGRGPDHRSGAGPPPPYDLPV